MGLQRTEERLLTALGKRGMAVRVEQRRFWSRKYERIMTKRIVLERDPTDGKWRRTLETYRLPEVVRYLASLYRGADG